MPQTPNINDSLLLRLRDRRDRDAWYEFVSVYRPIIYRIARRYGLQDADSQNLVQDVLCKAERQLTNTGEQSSVRGILRHDGSFQGWLATVAKNAAIDAIRRVRPDRAAGGSSVVESMNEVADRPDESAAVLEQELEREGFRWAARRIRDEFTESTWAAFWQTMVEGRSCAQVADEFGKSVGAVYTARSRVMQRLRQELESFNWTRILKQESDLDIERGRSSL